MSLTKIDIVEAINDKLGIQDRRSGRILTNCCVESTMRTAYEKGYDAETLKENR
jgi:hypothetical protein